MDFHSASIQKVARTTYKGNTCKFLLASNACQKKSCTCNFSKSCRCNFLKHRKTAGILTFSFGNQKVAGAIFQMLQVHFFFACAFSSSPVVENNCSAWSLMLECADAIYNRGFDAVGFTSLIHIFGEGFKNCQAALCIPLWKLSPICVLPTVAAPRLRPRWIRPRLRRLRCASLL